MRTVITKPSDISKLLDIPFSTQQLAAITAPMEPAVIIAGAGTGKTTVMAARVVWLVGTGQVSPDQVLGLTFTRKAAGELADRVSAALTKAGISSKPGPNDAGEQTMSTYDSFAQRVVAVHGMRIGLDTDQTMIAGAQRFRLAAQVVADASGSFEYLSGTFSTVTNRLLDLNEQLTSHLVTCTQMRQWTEDYLAALAQAPLWRGKPYAVIRDGEKVAKERLELLQLVEAYREAKKRLAVTEFSDQMAGAARLAMQVPEVGAKLREHFSVVLLDEYQDTSIAQSKMLSGLFTGDSVETGLGHPVTAVGDPYQAIYGWRGAAPSNILAFRTEFLKSDSTPATTYALSVNRRSDRKILDVANKLASPLRADERLQFAAENGELIDTRLVPPTGQAEGDLSAFVWQTWPEEVAWIAEEIISAKDRGEVANWSDIAVLTRKNAEIIAIYEALSDQDVPVEIVGLAGLLSLPEINEVVATLRLINDVTCDPAAVQLLSGPRWRIGAKDLAALGRREKGRCLMDALANPQDLPLSITATNRIKLFLAEYNRLSSQRDEPVLDLTQRVIKTLGLATEMRLKNRWAQVMKFQQAVSEYCGLTSEATLSGLLAWFDAELLEGVGLEQEVVSPDDSVKLLTVHKAKGLEWDLVFLPALVDKSFPDTKVGDNWVTSAKALPSDLRGDAAWVPTLLEVSKQGIEDFTKALKSEQRQAEDRLAYVAASRARHRLVASTHYWRQNRLTPSNPSEYFTDIEALIGQSSRPEVAEQNPLAERDTSVAWPVELNNDWVEAQREIADLVENWTCQDIQLSYEDEQIAKQWFEQAHLLVSEVKERRERKLSPVAQKSISASAAIIAANNQEQYLQQMLRPMPRLSNRMAGIGTRFHQWLEERFNKTPSLDELDMDWDEEENTDADRKLAQLKEAFEKGPYANRVPYAVEEPFILVTGDFQLRGRIDAVYKCTGEFDYQVVDWKTSDKPADELQLAIYRAAWAEIVGVAPERVDAIFYHVRSAKIQRATQLPSSEQLAKRLTKILALKP